MGTWDTDVVFDIVEVQCKLGDVESRNHLERLESVLFAASMDQITR